MGMSVGGSNRGIVSEMNVVPLIDVLLVLLVIFMIIPHHQTGLRAEIPQPAPANAPPSPQPDVIVVQVVDGGSLKINEQPVPWDSLRSRLDEIFARRADRTAFVSGDSAVEFQVVAKVIDVMDAAGISSVGLLAPQVEKGR